MSLRTPYAGSVDLAWDIGCELGEGPVWSPGEQALWFVDIKSAAIHRYGPDDERRSWTVAGEPGFALPATHGLIVGTAAGLHRFDPADGALTLLAEVEPDRPDNRLNDAFVSPDGAIWFGSMDNRETASTGALYRWHADTGAARRDDGYGITNGPALSPDGRTFYHTDTLARRVYAFDHRDGELSAKRVFLDLAGMAGYPDGTCVDAEGALWIGFFGDGHARRYSAAGTLTHEVRMPVSNVTKVALGGEDLTTAYVTTARVGLSPEKRAAEPLAGALFRFEAQVSGLPATRAALR